MDTAFFVEDQPADSCSLLCSCFPSEQAKCLRIEVQRYQMHRTKFLADELPHIGTTKRTKRTIAMAGGQGLGEKSKLVFPKLFHSEV